MYFRLLLIGYFEGIDAERGVAWRANDSLALRRFLRVGLDEAPPDHSTISRTRRLIDVEAHREVFTWVLKVLAEKGLLKGQTLGIDATPFEANAALRTIVRPDTGEGYQEFLQRMRQESGIPTPTREQLARLDRNRAHKGSNEDWEHRHDQDTCIAKMKDGGKGEGSTVIMTLFQPPVMTDQQFNDDVRSDPFGEKARPPYVCLDHP